VKVVYTEDALRDLDQILAFISANYPMVMPAFVQRLLTIERRIARWPNSAEEVEQRPGVRMVPFIRYPYKMFYRVANDAVEILFIHYSARRDPWHRAD
jgi:toxin ParE1/3/4